MSGRPSSGWPQDPKPRGYLPIDGLPGYVAAVRELVFGADSAVVAESRVVTVQALGGTGALKIGADFLRRFAPEAKVLISDPSWENHEALFTRAGFTVESYRYYDAAAKGIDFDGMIADLEAAPSGTIVVLHACCHNPTGYDLDAQQWGRVIETVQQPPVWCRSWTWPTRASPSPWRPTGRWFAGSPRPDFRCWCPPRSRRA